MAARPFLYRFSVDLRLDDHAGLAAAAAHSEVLPVLVIDEPLAVGCVPPRGAPPIFAARSGRSRRSCTNAVAV